MQCIARDRQIALASFLDREPIFPFDPHARGLIPYFTVDTFTQLRREIGQVREFKFLLSNTVNFYGFRLATLVEQRTVESWLSIPIRNLKKIVRKIRMKRFSYYLDIKLVKS